MYIIYLITRIDDLKYVGLTKSFKQRIKSHRKSDRFNMGIKSIDILEILEELNEAIIKEEYWITYYDTYEKGLNLTSHGGGNHDNKENFNTYGMSFTKNKKWYNNGEKNIRCFENEQPEGYVLGRYSSKKIKRFVPKKQRKRLSEFQKNKDIKLIPSKFNESQVLELFELLKMQPELNGVGEYNDLTKSMKATYLRQFCKKYKDHFNVEEFYLYSFIAKKGWKRWGYLWKEFFGENEPVFEKNKRMNITEKQVIDLFSTYDKEKKSKNLKEIVNNFCKNRKDLNITSSTCVKIIRRKGGKKWNYLYKKIVNDDEYIKNRNVVKEELIEKFFEDYKKFNGNKKEFYSLPVEKYGLSKDKARKLLVSKNKGKFQHIWDKVFHEDRNIN